MLGSWWLDIGRIWCRSPVLFVGFNIFLYFNPVVPFLEYFYFPIVHNLQNRLFILFWFRLEVEGNSFRPEFTEGVLQIVVVNLVFFGLDCHGFGCFEVQGGNLRDEWVCFGVDGNYFKGGSVRECSVEGGQELFFELRELGLVKIRGDFVDDFGSIKRSESLYVFWEDVRLKVFTLLGDLVNGCVSYFRWLYLLGFGCCLSWKIVLIKVHSLRGDRWDLLRRNPGLSRYLCLSWDRLLLNVGLVGGWWNRQICLNWFDSFWRVDCQWGNRIAIDLSCCDTHGLGLNWLRSNLLWGYGLSCDRF